MVTNGIIFCVSVNKRNTSRSSGQSFIVSVFFFQFFRNLNINNKRKEPPSSNNNPFTEKKYQLLHDAEKIYKFFHNIHNKKKLSFALTTKNTTVKETNLIGISFYTDDNKAYYLPLSQKYFAIHVLTKIKTGLKKIN